MRRLLVLAIIIGAGWYGWKHSSDLRQTPRDEAIVENQSGKEIDRFRLIVGDQAVVREQIAAGETVVLPFRVTHDGSLAIKWQYERSDIDQSWSGGEVVAGPLRTRHRLTIEPEGGVVWTSERIITGER